ncbi:hypothetical protein [Coprobacter tertius]|uniref:Uncharacterized protein n=1 Tax=Coprobacter tertius TaxID=2944915 RepID=A0ABT1MDW9_9BACT|nr:hypothetical protein [Coprobacter tertius]MCP9610827.1 hypothetical protein [Coprobacter tertius]
MAVLNSAIQSMKEQGMSEEEIKAKTGQIKKADNNFHDYDRPEYGERRPLFDLR